MGYAKTTTLAAFVVCRHEGRERAIQAHVQQDSYCGCSWWRLVAVMGMVVVVEEKEVISIVAQHLRLLLSSGVTYHESNVAVTGRRSTVIDRAMRCGQVGSAVAESIPIQRVPKAFASHECCMDLRR